MRLLIFGEDPLAFSAIRREIAPHHELFLAEDQEAVIEFLATGNRADMVFVTSTDSVGLIRACCSHNCGDVVVVTDYGKTESRKAEIGDVKGHITFLEDRGPTDRSWRHLVWQATNTQTEG